MNILGVALKPASPMMTERLLQFIWQFQYYNTSTLVTEEGQTLQVIHQGNFNSNQGPDFLNAKVIIGEHTWAGNIELHLRSSDWLRHRHQHDQHYNNTILHVVWQHDKAIQHADGSFIPTLALQHRVPNLMLQHYNVLNESNRFVLCDKFLPAMDNHKWIAWKERLLIERLQAKSGFVLQQLQKAGNHWEEMFWWILARNFGSTINADAFEAVARSLPLTTLVRHKQQVNQLECLLLGQANLLQKHFEEDYMQMLQREYKYLSHKYKLKAIATAPHFLRMRPANFPTIRLAQLAMLIHQSTHLFSQVLEATSIEQLKQLFNVTANDYWHYHYLPGETTPYKPKQLGKQMIENVIINTIVPVVFAYAHFHKNENLENKSIDWLHRLPPEENKITRYWQSRNVINEHAADSQALIQLKNNYCKGRLCLACAVGNAVLKQSKTGVPVMPVSPGA